MGTMVQEGGKNVLDIFLRGNQGEITVTGRSTLTTKAARRSYRASVAGVVVCSNSLPRFATMPDHRSLPLPTSIEQEKWGCYRG